MENQPVPQEAQKEEKSKKRRLIFIIIIQSVIIAILAGLYWNQTVRVETEIKEKIIYIDKSNGLQSELANLKEDYQSLETKDGALNQQLEEKIRQIEELQKEAEKHKGDASEIFKLKKEAETLRKIMKGFVRTIDSLNTLNIAITAEKKKVENDLTSEKGKTDQLSKDKKELEHVVAVGSMLQAQGITAKGIRLKSGGKKESETGKAKKTDKIKITFVIAENKIAKKGNKDLFVRVLTPDGKELSKNASESEMFELPNGTKSFYAAKQSFGYDNREVKMNVYCESKNGFVPGKYMIMVYNEETDIGTTTLVLE